MSGDGRDGKGAAALPCAIVPIAEQSTSDSV